MEKTYINPPDVYTAPWRFNQAVKVRGAGSLLFLSGIVGYELDGSIPAGDIVRQAENAYASLQRIVEEAGGTLRDVVKTNVWVGEDYQLHKDELREVRARYFEDDLPATTLLQVPGFANTSYLFEIEAIAALPD